MPAAEYLMRGLRYAFEKIVAKNGSSSRRVVVALPICVLVLSAIELCGQDVDPVPPPRSTISINIADNATLAHLDRFDALLAEQQWQEAIETIRRVIDTSDEQLVHLTPGNDAPPARFRRYVPIATYCKMKLADLSNRSPKALSLYRQQVDPAAARLLDLGKTQRDSEPLQELVTKYFASSHTADALMQLGELSLERGEWTEARGFWEQVSPLTRFPPHGDPKFGEFAGQPLWLITRHLLTADDWQKTLPLLQASDGPSNWLTCSDTKLSLADVHARLALVSILEGNDLRARAEIELVRRLYPNARGQFGGQSGLYVELLTKMLDQSQDWPALPRADGWPIFGRNSERQPISSGPIELANQPRWQIALPIFSGEGEFIGSEGSRVAESPNGLLSVHPIVTHGIVTVQAGASESDIVARRVSDGSVVFGPQELAAGVIALPGLKRSVGVPRFPLSSYESSVFARVGSFPTGTNVDLRLEREAPARIVGLDLNSEGRLAVDLRLEGPLWDAEWAFDGVPISDGNSLYIAMRRRSSARTENHVACFDARTARLRWRKRLVGADTVGSQRSFELTHTLLSLRNRTLYCNTNLGVVAALAVEDGAIQWLTEYPRIDFLNESPDRDTRHLFRDLTPCLLYRDLVIVAASDCDRVFALDANTGILLWVTMPEQAADAIHLLGVGEDYLIASGDYLYWFDVYTGQLVSQFPAPHRNLPGHTKPSPRGHGRGILVDKLVYWPTRESILVFDQRIRPVTIGRLPNATQRIDLLSRGVTGGNLVLTDEVLLIATENRLIAFDRDGKRTNSQLRTDTTDR